MIRRALSRHWSWPGLMHVILCAAQTGGCIYLSGSDLTISGTSLSGCAAESSRPEKAVQGPSPIIAAAPLLCTVGSADTSLHIQGTCWLGPLLS
eukprot:6214387-Pleurochrysis_carterae.AAC.2